jgi:hypothetical protein
MQSRVQRVQKVEKGDTTPGAQSAIKKDRKRVISGFRRGGNYICALLEFHAA